MKLLDLFCGAGGAAMGYYRAGFTDITGIDIKPQPRYPFQFIQADALEYLKEHGHEYDAIHASPPCQAYSQQTPKEHRGKHSKLIDDVRFIVQTFGKPYIIENVPSAKYYLKNPLMLCGSAFGLNLRRHRFFEIQSEVNGSYCPYFIALRPQCNHMKSPVIITGTHRRTYEPRYEYSVSQCREASGIDWMTRKELDQAIPPAYTEFIGRQLIDARLDEMVRRSGI